MRLLKWTLRGILVYLCLYGTALAQEFRRLPVQEYVDKMEAGWIGQMTGVSWVYPTGELKVSGTFFCGSLGLMIVDGSIIMQAWPA